jgi:hypothetical protein
MSNSLLFEEYFFIGFLPLKSYLDKKKRVNSGQLKCPPEKEEIVRALIFKDALESLNCTYAKQGSVSKIA